MIGCGPLSEIAARGDLPLAQRDDAGALLLCRVAEHDVRRELSRLEGGGATLWVPLLDAAVGSERRVRIPAREVILAGKPPEAISLHNIVPGLVRRMTSDTARRSVLVEIALPSGALIARVTPDAIVRLGLTTGQTGAGVDQVHIDRGTGQLAGRVAVTRRILPDMAMRFTASASRKHQR